MQFLASKTWGHETGLSCVFRQPLADSHCRLAHGYALSVRTDFACSELDRCNWVIDFGSLKPVKQFLVDTFDHKWIVAEDDPHLEDITMLQGLGLADVVVLPKVGCEAFAEYIFGWVSGWLEDELMWPRVWVHSVEVREHGGNGATYRRTS